jgi:hypothetical protein
VTVLLVILGVLVVLLVVAVAQARRDWGHPQRLERAARERGAL